MDRNTWKKPGELISVPVEAGTLIYTGHIVCVNAAGYAVPGKADATQLTMGVAYECVDNSTGAQGACSILVERCASFCFANSSANPVTQAMVGKLCYVLDSITVGPVAGADDAPTNQPVGKVMEVSPDGVWVYIA